MTRSNHLGEFEQLVLLALIRLDDAAYGIAVRDLIAERAGRRAGIGSVYATLDRLHRKGWVRSRVAPPTAIRGGRAKKYFFPTEQGLAALHRSLGMVERMKCGLRLEPDVGRRS